MNEYESIVEQDLKKWKASMKKGPSIFNGISKGIQTRINNLIPKKVHQVITVTIKQMTKAVLFGANYVSKKPMLQEDLKLTEALVKKQIDIYKKTAATEGAITGAGGILLNIADFPLLISIKMKLLFDIAALYGFDTKDYKERLYLLYIFQLAFSSQQRRNVIFNYLEHWNTHVNDLPKEVSEFDWQQFQQEYRDYIDLAKLAQLIPVIGAAVGAVANYQLILKLGNTAINAYRMRIFDKEKLLLQD